MNSEIRMELNPRDAEDIINHPEIYPHVKDDGSPPRFYVPEGMVTLVVYDPDPVACTAFHWKNSNTIEVHVQVLPKARKKSLEYGRAMLGWIWDNTPADKLVGLVHDRKTLLWTLKLGFKKEGVSTASIKQNGNLIDQTYIGISRCHQPHRLYQPPQA